MKIKVFIITILACATNALAQPVPTIGTTEWPLKPAAFAAGEKITFSVSYALGRVLRSDMINVEMKVTNTVINNIPAYRIYANASTLPNYKLFYDLDDTYETWLDQPTLKPLKSSSRLREAKYRYRSDRIFDWEKMQVHSISRNLKHSKDKQKTLTLTSNTFDALGFFYNLRSDDIESFIPGQERTFDFILDDTTRRISYKLLGRETKNLGKIGTFKTFKFSCKLATSTGETFKDGSEFFLWISDDRNRIPLYIESPIKVGSIVGTLTKFEGLKYPLDSKIK